MARSSRSLSRCTSGLLAVLLLGCGPHVQEQDGFIEQECTEWCDGVTDCPNSSLSWDECFDDCVDSPSWTESCRDPRAAYLGCLRDLSCEDLDERTQAAQAGEDLASYACYEESYAAAVCRND